MADRGDAEGAPGAPHPRPAHPRAAGRGGPRQPRLRPGGHPEQGGQSAGGAPGPGERRCRTTAAPCTSSSGWLGADPDNPQYQRYVAASLSMVGEVRVARGDPRAPCRPTPAPWTSSSSWPAPTPPTPTTSASDPPPPTSSRRCSSRSATLPPLTTGRKLTRCLRESRLRRPNLRTPIDSFSMMSRKRLAGMAPGCDCCAD